jgi:hypothetical protein
VKIADTNNPAGTRLFGPLKNNYGPLNKPIKLNLSAASSRSTKTMTRTISTNATERAP